MRGLAKFSHKNTQWAWWQSHILSRASFMRSQWKFSLQLYNHIPSFCSIMKHDNFHCYCSCHSQKRVLIILNLKLHCDTISNIIISRPQNMDLKIEIKVMSDQTCANYTFYILHNILLLSRKKQCPRRFGSLQLTHIWTMHGVDFGKGRCCLWLFEREWCGIGPIHHVRGFKSKAFGTINS